MKARLSRMHWGLVVRTAVLVYIVTFILGLVWTDRRRRHRSLGTVMAESMRLLWGMHSPVKRLDFLHHLRGERKFDGIAALVAQITSDVATARQWLKEHEV
jgi:hypothetical protein